jgi:arylsulfatase A
MKIQTLFILFIAFSNLLCAQKAQTLEASKTAKTAPPNIVFILTDDMGYFDLGCYGNPYNETPHIDALAKGGLRFTHAYSASPVCSPSRAALMTGKHPARLQLTAHLGGPKIDTASKIRVPSPKQGLHGDEITIAEKLKENGYNTGMIGKWHLGGGKGEITWEQGFDYSRVIGKNGLDYYNYSIYEDSYQKEFTDKGTTYLTDKLTDYAVQYIGNQSVAKPFFLYLAYSAPHVLTVPRADKLGKYFWKYEKFHGKYNPNYAAMIESVDDGVGRIVAELKAKGLFENTLIVFTSDNGGVGLPELGPTPTSVAPLSQWKGHLREGGIRIPAICFWQNTIAPNQTSDRPMMNTDYFPTLCELAGANANTALDAKSFSKMLKNPSERDERGVLYWHYPHWSNQNGIPAAAIRDGDWKLIRYFEDDKIELFNLKNDESETTDVSKKEAQRAAKMNGQLSQYLADVKAQLPTKK